MRSVAVFGVGLIGGSFALALRETGFEGEILGVSSPRTIETALSLGVVDRGVTAAEAVERADLLYLAQPVFTIMETLAAIGPSLRADSVVTDAGSTKALILEQARLHIRRGVFIGGHPMAGKERSGVGEADAALFRGRPYVLCPLQGSDAEHGPFFRLQDLIIRMGAKPIVLDAEQHDRLVAFTSHMPQLLSTALASLLSEVDNAELVAGPGVLGLTRLALSPFHMWRDIFQSNRENIRGAIAELVAKLNTFQSQLSSDELATEFERASAGSLRLRQEQKTQDF